MKSRESELFQYGILISLAEGQGNAPKHLFQVSTTQDRGLHFPPMHIDSVTCFGSVFFQLSNYRFKITCHECLKGKFKCLPKKICKFTDHLTE